MPLFNQSCKCSELGVGVRQKPCACVAQRLAAYQVCVWGGITVHPFMTDLGLNVLKPQLARDSQQEPPAESFSDDGFGKAHAVFGTRMAVFANVQFAARVVAHNAAAHDEDTRLLSRLYQLAVVNIRLALALFKVHAQHLPNIGCHSAWAGADFEFAHEGQGLAPLFLLVIGVPSLALQGVLDGFDQVDAGFFNRSTTERAQLGQQRCGFWWLLQKEKPNGACSAWATFCACLKVGKPSPISQRSSCSGLTCAALAAVCKSMPTRPRAQRSMDGLMWAWGVAMLKFQRPGMLLAYVSKSSKVRATTLVARRRSCSCTCSSARLALDSRTVRGPAP